MDKKVNPFAERDLTKRLLYPTLSWSSLNAFANYDRAGWYDAYVLGNKFTPNGAMQAGIDIGERLATDPTYLPEVPRLAVFEQELECDIDGIFLRGHLDGFDKDTPALAEYKTYQKDSAWNQKKVNFWKQIDCYCLLIYKNYGIKPEQLSITLTAIPVTENGNFKVERDERPIRTYKTKRKMADILKFIVWMKQTKAEMEEFIKTKK